MRNYEVSVSEWRGWQNQEDMWSILSMNLEGINDKRKFSRSRKNIERVWRR